MCGICGYQGAFQNGLIQKMTGRIAHRGPDDQSFYEGPAKNVALGHTRLSIIDLSAEGRQPLKNETGSVFIVCNGEIYNYQSLRSELINKGHTFTSQSDSEVLIHLYEEEGPAMLSRLNGIFAFAIYDEQKDELFCVRDHLGVKPFYYSQVNDFFIFSSELKSILCAPQIPREINFSAIHNYLTFLWSPSPATMLKHVFKLEPGFAMIVKNGKIQRQWRYWDIPYGQRDLILSESDCVRQVQDSVYEAVKRQLVSDVPVGAFLSGGLDSSAVVAMMKKINPTERPKCYTIAYGGGKKYEGFVNDLPYARQVARHLDVDLQEIVIDFDIVKNLEKLINYREEHKADLAPINIMLICEAAKQQGMKVLLSGAGGDDIFSGYRRHAALYLERYWAWLPHGFRLALQSGAGQLPVKWPTARRARKLFEYASLDARERLIASFFWLNQDRVRELYTDEARQALGDYNAFAPMLQHLSAIPGEKNRLNQMLYLESKTFLPDHNLNYTDKVSMASGIEVRVPLLDIELVELCTRIPPQFKQNAMVGKYIFKKAMEPYLPHGVIYRPKGAIAAPLRTWLAHDLKELVHDTLSAERINKRGWFNQKAVQRLIEDNEANRVDAAYTIWALVSLEIWASLFLD